MKQNVLQSLSLVLAFYYLRYENIIIIGDFNMAVENHHLSDFMQTIAFSGFITKPTCHQSKIATCIDLIPANKDNLFKLSDNFETVLADHHMLISTIMKSGNFKRPSKKKLHRSYKNLDVFNNALNLEIYSIEKNNSYTLFEEKFLYVSYKQAPSKSKLLRYNNNAFMSKELRKSIILRSKLKNNYNKSRSNENWCKYTR